MSQLSFNEIFKPFQFPSFLPQHELSSYHSSVTYDRRPLILIFAAKSKLSSQLTIPQVYLIFYGNYTLFSIIFPKKISNKWQI